MPCISGKLDPCKIQVDKGLLMKCDRCGSEIDSGEEKEYLGQTLCEDCYIDVLSPLRACDPWAVHSAKSFEKHYGGNQTQTLTPLQSEIINILEETGPIESSELQQRLGTKITLKELEREFAVLRHMEKVRGEKRDNRVLLRLWGK
jgi:hypothetical protein